MLWFVFGEYILNWVFLFKKKSKESVIYFNKNTINLIISENP